MARLERQYQSNLIARLSSLVGRNGMVIKTDPNYIQGIPDILILYKDKWAVLENKAYANAPHRPNQDHYINLTNAMSFGKFIYPENEEVVLNELQQTFRPRR